MTVLLVFCEQHEFKKTGDSKIRRRYYVHFGIADGEKLRKFLELNPEVPADRVFVDTSKTFEAYKAAGFGNLTDVDKSTKPEMKPPGFSLQDWWKYITNVHRVVSHRPELKNSQVLPKAFCVSAGRSF